MSSATIAWTWMPIWEETHHEMRPLVLCAIALCCAGATGCGGAGGGSRSTSQPTPGTVASGNAGYRAATGDSASTQAAIKRDKDNDYDGSGVGYYDSDDAARLRYGRAASAAEVQAVSLLVKRYYAAAAAGDGAKACSLMYSIFAEAIPEEYGRPPAGPPALRGKTCAVVLSKVFWQHRQQLVADSATVKVTGVRVEGNRGWALMTFGSMPVRSILVHREVGAWKIYAVLDSELP